MAVVGATVTVFAGSAPELRHGDDYRIVGKVAEIDPEGGERSGEVAQYVGDLPLRAAFVDVVVPAADIGERHLYAEICFDELSELSQAVAEAASWVVRTRSGFVLGRIGGFQHFYRVERLLPGSMQNGIHRLVVHGFKSVRDGSRIRVAATDTEVVDVVHGDGAFGARQNSWECGTERDGAEGRVVS